MRRNVLILAAMAMLLVLILAGFTQQALHASHPIPPKKHTPAPLLDLPHATDHVLVKLAAQSVAYEPPAGYEHIFGNWYRAPVQTGTTIQATLDRLSASAQVEIVEPDYRLDVGPERTQPLNTSPDKRYPDHLSFTPNDPLYPRQWHFPPIQAPAAWEITQGSGVTVAIVDSGISKGTDLACRTFVHDFNAITNQSGPGVANDDYGHGTHVAGTVAQCTNNGLGVAGLAFTANLMPVKVLDARGAGYFSDVAQGIDWARTHGADVINLSLAGPCNGQTWPGCSFSIINDAIAAAAADDIFIAAAAGNSNQSSVGTPANHPDAVAVAAVDYNLERAPYSNRGAALSVSAPGGDLDQDANNDGNGDGVLQQTHHQSVWGYWYIDGTSMASPHVAGAAAMLRALYPQATRQQLQSALETTALDRGAPGFDTNYGYGVIQIADAISALGQQFPTPTLTPTRTPTSTMVWLPVLWRSYLPPTATPTPKTCVEQVRNGGFEENSAWVFPYTPNQARYTRSIVHTGQRSVGLGMQPGATNQVGRTTRGGAINTASKWKSTVGGVHSIAYQSLTIPADIETATLTFWHWLGTEDNDGDWQRVTLISPTNYSIIVEPMNGLEHNGDWQRFEYDLTPHQGLDMLLYVEVFNDKDDDETWMYVDDISLETCRVIRKP